ncbi:NADH dehydrogenase [ubiquinone] 1 alpha subcomplex subunit 13 [Melipona quadrifasciata]|uniref:NADH dehydrogenase [ubiquinone] 1 alpha subcomplex subunit 13 n=1 Tax=Melipona quadrifasciata TaxID=166423 RepID=A0A0M9A9T5_9HYME|nr:NADH dehydrogenase [ubiquinone] 1 alpha subcomplex subunit 13 [Melipona quadrifasciata]
MSKVKGPQDLPPKGGYVPFQIERIKLRSIVTGKLGIGIFIVTNIIGMPMYMHSWLRERKLIIEAKSRELATLPILFAENDRAMLKQLKHVRELEADVMKDFPYWEVGTFFGEPIYEDAQPDTYIKPIAEELFVFTDPKERPVLEYIHLLS